MSCADHTQGFSDSTCQSTWGLAPIAAVGVVSTAVGVVSAVVGVVIDDTPSEALDLQAADYFCVCLCLSPRLCFLRVAFCKCSPAVETLFFIWSLQLFLRD